MSEAGLIPLRAAEIVDELRAAALGVTLRSAERAVHRVLRARGRRSGDGIVHPPVAALYLSPVVHQRLAALLEAEIPAMARRIAERLDRDHPAPLRLYVRCDARVRHLQVAAPVVRDVVPVRRPSRHDTDPTRLDPTPPDPTQLDRTRLDPSPARSPGLALQPRDGGGAPIPVRERGLTLGRGDLGPGRVLDRRVSREHTELIPSGPDRLRCRDLGSRNGTWVDGARITHAVDLGPGQHLRVGDTEFQIVRHDLTIHGGDA